MAVTQYSLRKNQIALWYIPFISNISINEQICSTQEVTRASRYLRKKQGKQFLYFKVAVRAILGHYLEIAPKQLIFKNQHNGKPYLADFNLQFNLSHCQEMAILAVSQTTALGVDIEKEQLSPQWQGIAEKMFEAPQVQNLLALEGKKRTSAFCAYWTALEARQKCLGSGLFKEKAEPKWFAIRYFYDLPTYTICLAWQKKALTEPLITFHQYNQADFF